MSEKIANSQPAEHAPKIVAAGVRTRWKPGQSGNPAGRACLGSSWLEWCNAMSNWLEEDVRSVANDVDEPLVRRAAARDLLRWNSDATTKAGHPIASDAADRLLDRVLGKPLVSLVSTRIESEGTSELRNIPIEKLREIAALLDGREIPTALPQITAESNPQK